MTEPARSTLARLMVSTLPKFGQWTNGFREFETPYGKVGFRQLAILWAIRYELIPANEVSAGRLAVLHDVQPSVITRALAKLQAAGFISRTPDPGDKRRSYIAITGKGTSVSEYVEHLYIQDIVASMAFLGDDEVDELRHYVEVLGRIVDDLEQKRVGRSSSMTVRDD